MFILLSKSVIYFTFWTKIRVFDTWKSAFSSVILAVARIIVPSSFTPINYKLAGFEWKNDKKHLTQSKTQKDQYYVQ
jgi:hypothetical protein